VIPVFEAVRGEAGFATWALAIPWRRRVPPWIGLHSGQVRAPPDSRYGILSIDPPSSSIALRHSALVGLRQGRQSFSPVANGVVVVRPLGGR
jgi:hypothetical protein